MDGEHVAASLLDRAEVDVLTGVVARRLIRGLGVRRQREVGLAAREDSAVDVVDALSVVLTCGHDLGDPLGEEGAVAAGHVSQPHVRSHRLELDAQSKRIAQGTVGIGKAVEEVGVLVGRRRGHDSTVTGEDV